MLEHGAYLLLMAEYYQHGSLPANAKQLLRVCMAVDPAECAAVESVLQEFFTLEGPEPGRWVNKRIEEELEKAREISKKRSIAGKKGGEKTSQANAKQMPQQMPPLSLSQSHKELNPPVVPPSKAKRFKPPTVDEVRAYCRERANSVDPDQWHDHYTANGWKVGKNPMKDWKASVRTWERSPDEARKQAPSRAKRVSDKLDDIIRKSLAGDPLDGSDIPETASPVWPQVDSGYRRN